MVHGGPLLLTITHDTVVKHGGKSLIGLPSAARRLLRRVQFHHTPKHASWLNMAEIEISILDRQCLGRRLMDRATARREVHSWQRQRNAERRGRDWTFTRRDADRKLSRHYVS